MREIVKSFIEEPKPWKRKQLTTAELEFALRRIEENKKKEESKTEEKEKS